MKNTDNTLTRIYNLADELRKLSPWQYMSEDDIFGIKIPESDRIYFISIMGTLGEVYALTAYEGSVALGQFWEIQNDPYGGRPESVLTIPNIMLSFENSTDMNKTELKRIKELGFKFTGSKSWPELKHTVPGFLPVFPENPYLNDMEIILEQSLNVIKRIKNKKDIITPDYKNPDVYLIRELADSEKWKDVYETIIPEDKSIFVGYDSSLLEELIHMPQHKKTLQTDLLIIPNAIKEKGGKPYFPFLILVVDKKSGIIEGFQMLTPVPNIDKMYASIPMELLKLLINNNYKPETLELKSNLLASLIGPMIEKTGIDFVFNPEMDALEEAFKALIAHFG